MRALAKRLAVLASAAMMALPLSLMTACNQTGKVWINEPMTFPLEEEVTLTWWYPFDNTFMPDFNTLSDHPFIQRMKERTNVNIQFSHPTASGLSETKTELMNKLASGNMEDMISHSFFFPDIEGNTIDTLEEEEVYLRLNDYVDVQMPNFNAMRQKYAIIDKCTVTQQGNIFYIPTLTGVGTNDKRPNTSGLVIRKDMLDELQLAVPETIDEWYNVLTKLKVSLGVETPLAAGSMIFAPSMPNDVFITCYNQMYELYLDDEGKVRYGAIEEGVYEYVKMMHQWVAEDIARQVDVTNEERAGDEVAAWAGGIDDILERKKIAQNPDYELVAAPDPVLNKGDKIVYRANYQPIGNKNNGCVFLSYTCSNPAVACKFLDQFFTEEMYMETSYGIEGEDYVKNEDGSISFTEKITGNPDGIRYGIVQNAFLDSFYHDPDVLINFVYDDEALAAVETWSKATSERNMVVLDSMQLTAEESEALNGLNNFWNIQMGNLKGFISGEKPLTEWDSFVREMQDAGLTDYIAIVQTAWDRFLLGA